MLTFAVKQQRWIGCYDGLQVWMSDETFQRYVRKHLADKGITDPTREQHAQAEVACRVISYWYGNLDTQHVHMLQLDDPPPDKEPIQ